MLSPFCFFSLLFFLFGDFHCFTVCDYLRLLSKDIPPQPYNKQEYIRRFTSTDIFLVWFVFLLLLFLISVFHICSLEPPLRPGDTDIRTAYYRHDYLGACLPKYLPEGTIEQQPAVLPFTNSNTSSYFTFSRLLVQLQTGQPDNPRRHFNYSQSAEHGSITPTKVPPINASWFWTASNCLGPGNCCTTLYNTYSYSHTVQSSPICTYRSDIQPAKVTHSHLDLSSVLSRSGNYRSIPSEHRFPSRSLHSPDPTRPSYFETTHPTQGPTAFPKLA